MAQPRHAKAETGSMHPEVNIALVGRGFMGRAHSLAWDLVNKFFQPPVKANLHTLCGANPAGLAEFAQTWGWKNFSADWRKTITSSEIGLVDLTVPNNAHAELAIAALEAGKHVACEKPLANTLEDGRQMVAAAGKAKGKTFILWNYRRCPAVALAHLLVKQGRLGELRHVRGVFLQDWAKADVPLIWRFDKKVAGTGSQGDLNAHVLDMAMFVTGQRITEICGAMAETFVKERNVQTGGAAGGIAAGMKAAAKKGKVTVDDAFLMLAKMSGGAVASFEATRMATGNQNRCGLEINGDKGSLRFNFERMNELEFYDAQAQRDRQGWTTIMCTHGGSHPYADHWWPDAHVLGYENTFVNQAYDILCAIDGAQPVVPLADFAEAYYVQRVLAASMIAASQKRWVKLAEVK